VTRWVTTGTACQVLGVCIRTVQRWCEDGLIPPAHYLLTPGGQYRLDLEHLHHLRDHLKEKATNATSLCSRLNNHRGCENGGPEAVDTQTNNVKGDFVGGARSSSCHRQAKGEASCTSS
jgi:excisionase family DNA binding protein